MASDVWKKLGIAPTRDTRIIKRAFRQKKRKASNQREIWLLEEDYRHALRLAEYGDFEEGDNSHIHVASGPDPREKEPGGGRGGMAQSCFSFLLMAVVFILIVGLKSGILLDFFKDEPTEEIIERLDTSGLTIETGIKTNNLAMVLQGLEAGDDPDMLISDSSRPALLEATLMCEDTKIAMALIEYGAEINVVDGNGRNALHYAAARGHEELVVFLLANGITPNLEDENGHTPRYLAGHLGFQNIVRVLEEFMAQ